MDYNHGCLGEFFWRRGRAKNAASRSINVRVFEVALHGTEACCDLRCNAVDLIALRYGCYYVLIECVAGREY